MNPPTVTPSDLLTFHAAHIAPFLPLHDPPAHPSDTDTYNDYYHEEEEEQEEEDELGYYLDGAKRTLTDVQIAIFRHSEIQRLLQERRRRREASSSPSRASSVSGSPPCETNPKPLPTPTPQPDPTPRAQQPSGTKRKAEEDSGDTTEETRKQKRREAARRKMQALGFEGKGTRVDLGEKAVVDVREDDEFTARRFARELDEVVKEEVGELDYG